MARLGRYFLPGQPLHVIQRGNNREPVFFEPEDYRRYLDWLGAAAAEHGVAVHAYVLMTNHVHLLATPRDAGALSRTMQSLGRRYVRHVNAAYGRTGTLWEGRYRAAPIEAEAHLIACMRYIELNPVRARMVRRPGNYPWSSHPAHAAGERDPLLTPHPLYTALGGSPGKRAAAYAALFGEALPAEFMDALRRATNGGWALGNARWRAKIERVTKRRATPLPPGPPRREPKRKPPDARQGRLL
jgi:putative transposase